MSKAISREAEGYNEARKDNYRFLEKPSDMPFKVYRRLPIEIEAIKIGRSFSVYTLEGIMEGKAGDYLVCGIDGELYPVKESIFERTYLPETDAGREYLERETVVAEGMVEAVDGLDMEIAWINNENVTQIFRPYNGKHVRVIVEEVE